MSLDIKKLKAGALACIGQDKPASELAEYINNSFEDIRAYAEEDDLVVRGGERYIVVKRIGPDRFHVAENVTIPSTRSAWPVPAAPPSSSTPISPSL